MTSVEVRLFRRDDREQLTALVNAHAQAVVPGSWVSVNGVLSQLEREPGEFIVDPWVVERVTLVAEQRGRIAAAAHLLRYGAEAAVSESYRGVGEIRWLVCWPEASVWPDASAAGDAIALAAVAYLTRSGAVKVYADGALPAPGVYGIPEQWPHVQGILHRVGFVPGDRTELVFLADVAALRRSKPWPGLTLRRTVGSSGTRLSAMAGDSTWGYIELDAGIGDVGRVVRREGWADVGNLFVEETHRRQGVASWLLGEAAEWLRLAHIDRLLDYSPPEHQGYIAFLEQAGFRLLTRTTRGWEVPIDLPAR